MTCIICKGKGTISSKQAEICYNCFGSGELARSAIKTTELHNEVEADKLPFTDLEDCT